MVRSQPRDGAEEATRRSFLRPVPGLANSARRLPHGWRRGLLFFALRALKVAPSATFFRPSGSKLSQRPAGVGGHHRIFRGGQFLQGRAEFFEPRVPHRSEERRVGKESRSRWSPAHGWGRILL